MKCRSRDRRVSVGVAFLVVAVATLTASALPSRAWAQAEDQAGARALFTEGKQLMKAGKYAEACPKLESAQKLYSSAGILLNLGDCYEKVGRTASAWTRFGEAASVATRSNRSEDADEAHRRQEALEPALVRLVIRVSSPVPGLVVTRDGVALDEAIWGTKLPVDPGDHLVRAEAPGYEPWSTSVSITKRGDTLTVKVPKLGAAATVEKVAPDRIQDTPPKPVAHASGGGGNGLAWGLLLGGVVVGAGGGTLMVIESQRAGSARNKMDQAGYDATRTPWTIGLVSAIAGGVAGVAGVVLFVVGSGSSSDSSSSADTTTAWIAPGPGGIQIGGTF
jgi:hypothetical protein